MKSAGIPNAFLMLGIPGAESYRTTFFWTLHVEFWFYLLFPLVFLPFPTRILRTLVLLAIGGASLYYASHSNLTGSLRALFPVAVVQLIHHATEFMIGALIALWSKQIRFIQRRFSWALLGIGMAGLVGFYFNLFNVDLFGPQQYIWRFAIAIATGIVIIAWCGGHLNSIVVPGLSYIGLISYSLYLVHLPVLEFMSSAEIPGQALGEIAPLLMIRRGLDPVHVIHYIVICSAFATMTYFWLEKPFMNLGRKLSRIIESKAKAARGNIRNNVPVQPEQIRK